MAQIVVFVAIRSMVLGAFRCRSVQSNISA